MSLPLAQSRRNSLQDISPCYEPGAASPIPILPIILAQTEITKTFSPSKLLAQEEIGRKPWTSLDASGSTDMQFRASKGTNVRFSPYTMTVSGRHDLRGFSTGISSEAEHNEHDNSTPKSSDTTSKALIPKPQGEAGRPGRGGYTFSKQVKLKKTDIAQIKSFVSDIVQKQLDTSKCFAAQSPKLINIVEKLVAERFPVMYTYENLWPVTDLIRFRLKYTSSESRKAQDKADAKLGKALRSSDK